MCVCVQVCVRACVRARVCVCVCLQNMRHTAPNCITVYTYVMRFRLVPFQALQTRVTEIAEHFVFQAFV